MADLVMAASSNALRHARAAGVREVTPDHLLLGALEAAARLGIVLLGPLKIDLHELTENGDRAPVEDPHARRPSYAPDTAALFDRAARIAREDGEPKVRLVHLLAAFGPDDGRLMRRLMERLDFDDAGWRVALAEWDRRAGGAGSDRPGRDRVLSVDDAAETLDVHPQTVRGYIRSGKLTAYRIAGERAIRIFASDLYDLLEPLEPESDERTEEG